MNVELVAQMFKNYRSNVLFHLEGQKRDSYLFAWYQALICTIYSNRQPP